MTYKLKEGYNIKIHFLQFHKKIIVFRISCVTTSDPLLKCDNHHPGLCCEVTLKTYIKSIDIFMKLYDFKACEFHSLNEFLINLNWAGLLYNKGCECRL